MAKQAKSLIFSSIIGIQKSKIILRRITSWNIMFSDVYFGHVYIAVQGTNNQEWIRFVSSMSVWQFMLKECNEGISDFTSYFPPPALTCRRQAYPSLRWSLGFRNDIKGCKMLPRGTATRSCCKVCGEGQQTQPRSQIIIPNTIYTARTIS